AGALPRPSDARALWPLSSVTLNKGGQVVSRTAMNVHRTGIAEADFRLAIRTDLCDERNWYRILDPMGICADSADILRIWEAFFVVLAEFCELLGDGIFHFPENNFQGVPGVRIHVSDFAADLESLAHSRAIWRL